MSTKIILIKSTAGSQIIIQDFSIRLRDFPKPTVYCKILSIQELYKMISVLRANNCSEVDGKWYEPYDVCCDSENLHAPECEVYWTAVIIICTLVGWWVFIYVVYDCVNFRFKIIKTYCHRKIHYVKTYGTERSNISTISADLRQPPRPIVSKTPIAPADSVI